MIWFHGHGHGHEKLVDWLITDIISRNNFIYYSFVFLLIMGENGLTYYSAWREGDGN